MAALSGPFVALLGRDSADQAGDGGVVGEDAHDVRAVPDLLVQPLPGVVGRDLPPETSRGRAVNARTLSRTCTARTVIACPVGDV